MLNRGLNGAKGLFDFNLKPQIFRSQHVDGKKKRRAPKRKKAEQKSEFSFGLSKQKKNKIGASKQKAVAVGPKAIVNDDHHLKVPTAAEDVAMMQQDDQGSTQFKTLMTL